ncbi:hypothetical protein AMECASPLE_006919, partial [Ameca splendens]
RGRRCFTINLILDVICDVTRKEKITLAVAFQPAGSLVLNAKTKTHPLPAVTAVSMVIVQQACQ